MMKKRILTGVLSFILFTTSIGFNVNAYEGYNTSTEVESSTEDIDNSVLSDVENEDAEKNIENQDNNISDTSVDETVNTVQEIEDSDSNFAENLDNSVTEEMYDSLLVEQSFKEVVDGYEVTVSGKMPENSEVKVKRLSGLDKYKSRIEKERNVNDYEVYAAFDITVYADGEEWQPVNFNEKVQVEIKNVNLDDDRLTSVYRMTSDTDIDMMTTSANDGVVLFDTDHFTPYVVGSTEYDSETTTYLLSGSLFNSKLKSIYTKPTNIVWVDTPFTSSYELQESGAKVYGRLNETIIEIYTSAKKVYLNQNCKSMFSSCNTLVNIDFLSDVKIDTSLVTNMGNMFANCNALYSLNLYRFDTSNVTNMFKMFYNCRNLTNLSTDEFNETTRLLFDTSAVKDMSYMFYFCSNLIIDVSNFNTSNVSDFSYMFYCCSSIISLDLENFTGRGTYGSDCTYMFNGCSSLHDLNIKNLNIGSASRMFSGCEGLSLLTAPSITRYVELPHAFYLYDNNILDDTVEYTSLIQDSLSHVYSLGNFTYISLSYGDIFKGFTQDTSKQYKINVTFVNTYRDTLTNLDVSIRGLPFYSDWEYDSDTNTYNVYLYTKATKIFVIRANYMYRHNILYHSYSEYYYGDIQCEDISYLRNFDYSKCTDINSMFIDCLADTIDLRFLNVTQENLQNSYGEVSLSKMFANCKNIKTIDLSPLSYLTIGSMYYCFAGCTSLESLDLSVLNITNLKDDSNVSISDICYCCTKLQNVVFSDNIGVLNADSAFERCYELVSIDFKGAILKGLNSTFKSCYKLQFLNNYEIAKTGITNMKEAFYDCKLLESIDFTGVDTSKVTNMLNMFDGCESLVSLDLSSFTSNSIQFNNNSGSLSFYRCSHLENLNMKNFVLKRDLSLLNLTALKQFYMSDSEYVVKFPSNTVWKIDGDSTDTLYAITDKNKPGLYKRVEGVVILDTASNISSKIKSFVGYKSTIDVKVLECSEMKNIASEDVWVNISITDTPCYLYANVSSDNNYNIWYFATDSEYIFLNSKSDYFFGNGTFLDLQDFMDKARFDYLDVSSKLFASTFGSSYSTVVNPLVIRNKKGYVKLNDLHTKSDLTIENCDKVVMSGFLNLEGKLTIKNSIIVPDDWDNSDFLNNSTISDLVIQDSKFDGTHDSKMFSNSVLNTTQLDLSGLDCSNAYVNTGFNFTECKKPLDYINLGNMTLTPVQVNNSVGNGYPNYGRFFDCANMQLSVLDISNISIYDRGKYDILLNIKPDKIIFNNSTERIKNRKIFFNDYYKLETEDEIANRYISSFGTYIKGDYVADTTESYLYNGYLFNLYVHTYYPISISYNTPDISKCIMLQESGLPIYYNNEEKVIYVDSNSSIIYCNKNSDLMFKSSNTTNSLITDLHLNFNKVESLDTGFARSDINDSSVYSLDLSSCKNLKYAFGSCKNLKNVVFNTEFAEGVQLIGLFIPSYNSSSDKCNVESIDFSNASKLIADSGYSSDEILDSSALPKLKYVKLPLEASSGVSFFSLRWMYQDFNGDFVQDSTDSVYRISNLAGTDKINQYVTSNIYSIQFYIASVNIKNIAYAKTDSPNLDDFPIEFNNKPLSSWYIDNNYQTLATADNLSKQNTILYAYQLSNYVNIYFNAGTDEYKSDEVSRLEELGYKINNNKLYKTIKRGELYSSLPVLESTDSSYFAGWRTQSGLPITSKNTVLVTQNQTLNPYFATNAADLTVTYHFSPTNIQVDTETYAYGSKITNKYADVVDTWYFDKDYTIPWDFDNDVLEGNLDLYAENLDANTTVTFANISDGSTLETLGIRYYPTHDLNGVISDSFETTEEYNTYISSFDTKVSEKYFTGFYITEEGLTANALDIDTIKLPMVDTIEKDNVTYTPIDIKSTNLKFKENTIIYVNYADKVSTLVTGAIFNSTLNTLASDAGASEIQDVNFVSTPFTSTARVDSDGLPIYARVVEDNGVYKFEMYTPATTVYMNSDSSYMFSKTADDKVNISGIKMLANNVLDCSNLENVSYMFSGDNFTPSYNSWYDFTKLDTSNVTNFEGLFSNVPKISDTSSEIEDLITNYLNLNSIVNASYIFKGAVLKDTILGNIFAEFNNKNSLETMKGMFENINFIPSSTDTNGVQLILDTYDTDGNRPDFWNNSSIDKSSMFKNLGVSGARIVGVTFPANLTTIPEEFLADNEYLVTLSGVSNIEAIGTNAFRIATSGLPLGTNVSETDISNSCWNTYDWEGSNRTVGKFMIQVPGKVLVSQIEGSDTGDTQVEFSLGIKKFINDENLNIGFINIIESKGTKTNSIRKYDLVNDNIIDLGFSEDSIYYNHTDTEKKPIFYKNITLEDKNSEEFLVGGQDFNISSIKYKLNRDTSENTSSDVFIGKVPIILWGTTKPEYVN